MKKFLFIVLYLFLQGICFDNAFANDIDSIIYKADSLYYICGNDSLACEYIEDAFLRVENNDSMQYAILLDSWAHYACDIYTEEAIGRAEEAMAMLECDSLSIDYANCLSILGYCYSIIEIDSLKNRRLAEDYCRRAISILRQVTADDNEDLLSAISHLSGALWETGKYQKSIEAADSVINIIQPMIENMDSLLDKEQYLIRYKILEALSLAYHNKAVALFFQGKYNESVYYDRMNIQMRYDTWGRNPYYATSLYNMAYSEEKIGDYESAYHHYAESYNTFLECGQLDTKDIIDYYCHFVELELKSNRLFEARRDFSVILELHDLYDFSINTHLHARVLNVAAQYWSYIGDYPRLSAIFDESYELNKGDCLDDDIHVHFLLLSCNASLAHETSMSFQEHYEELYGSKHIFALTNLPNVVKTSLAVGDWDKADSIATCFVYRTRECIKQLFPFMTPDSRELFISNNCKLLFSYVPYVFNLTRRDNFSQTLYDLTLLRKGILLRTEQEIDNIIKQSNNREAEGLYHDILDNMGILRQSTSPEYSDSISFIISSMQKEIQELIPSLKDMNNCYDVSWTDIKNELNEDEVAVEFLDIVDAQTGNKSCKALIVTSDCERPYYVDLFNETDLMNIDKDDYYSTYYLFALIWDPIEARFLRDQDKNNIKKVYFSPSSLISQIALESLLDYEGNRVSSKREYYRVSSTRELLQRNNTAEVQDAVVYGGLKYDANKDDLADANIQYGSFNNMRSVAPIEIFDSLSINRGGVQYLPATKEEAHQIAGILSKKQVNCRLFEDIYGTEESFMNMNGKSPGILHIATHGFYWSASEQDSIKAKRALMIPQYGLSNEEKALSRSGLLLSGANNVLMGNNIPETMQDGILTAQEISKIDLSGLDLVVLSACETGLGDIKDGEGIMGLQRGFKKAGAKSLIMSLWEVDDVATQMLMTEFYKQYLNGIPMSQSLLNSQRYVESQKGFEDPEYWAGFILLDGLN